MRSDLFPIGFMQRHVYTLCLLVAILTACNLSPSQKPLLPSSAVQTSPSAPAFTQEPSQDTSSSALPAPQESLAPQDSPSPSPEIVSAGTPIPEEMIATLLAANQTPTRKPSPTPSVPLSYLYISQPGPLSKVTSPVTLLASVIPGSGGVVRIELIGEDGRVLVRDVERYNMPNGARFGIGPEINFEIPGVSEAARLQVSVSDARGRPIAMSAVRIILLSLGDAEINPQNDFQEPFYVTSPHPDAVITGGNLTVTGRARPLNSNPMIFELFDEKAQLVGSRQIEAPVSKDGSFLPFTAEIPYLVTKQTPVRLVIRQPDDDIPGDIALSSLTLILKP